MILVLHEKTVLYMYQLGLGTTQSPIPLDFYQLYVSVMISICYNENFLY